jgi:glycosyltransferase involved in cell wall biosynthesis
MNNKKTNPPRRVLLIAPFKAPFIDVDIEIIQQFRKVTTLIQSGVKAIFSILWKIFFCDIVFCWFGSVYSSIAVIWAKILNKKSIIIIGGVDAAALPEINYGIWLTPWKANLLSHGLRNADLILVVAPSMKDKIKTLAKYDGKNIAYLPTGYDTDFWTLGDDKEKIILTVGESDTETRLKKKGVDYLLVAAEKLPEIPFILIGLEKKLLDSVGLKVPQNMKLLPAMPQDELKSYYQKCYVFCQPSRSEGMPNTLCEAMACGCIPVGTDIDGIPTAIGDTGLVVSLGDISALVAALKKAIEMDEKLGIKARERIISEFPLQRRIEGLKKALDLLTDRHEDRSNWKKI